MTTTTTLPRVSEQASERALMEAACARRYSDGGYKHTSILMRLSTERDAYRAGWQDRAAITQQAAPEAPNYPALQGLNNPYNEKDHGPGWQVAAHAWDEAIISAMRIVGRPVAAPEAPTSEQAHVLPPFASPAGQLGASVETLTIERIVQLIDENTDRDFGLIVEPFARAVESEVASRFRAQGGNTNVNWRDCEDCSGTGRISPNELCVRCDRSGILPAATTASASVEDRICDDCGADTSYASHWLNCKYRAPAPSREDSESFADWLKREMPAGTVIGDPAWWAPRILRAALAQQSAA